MKKRHGTGVYKRKAHMIVLPYFNNEEPIVYEAEATTFASPTSSS